MKGCDAVIGADIHCRVEVYNRETQKWEKIYMYVPDKYTPGRLCEVEPYNGRRYMMFGVLAGIRYMVEPIVQPRGIPNDVSHGVLCDWEQEEDWCHTPSWLTLAELRLATKDKERYNKEERRSLRPLIDGIDFIVDASWRYVEDSEVRLVFWFDN